jgi:HEAT repeat protein
MPSRRGFASLRLATFTVLAIFIALPTTAFAQEEAPATPVFDGRSVDDWAEEVGNGDILTIMALARGGPEAHPVLRALLRRIDPEILKGALTIVSRCAGTGAPLVPDVVSALRHPDVEVRVAAAGALHSFPDHASTIPALIATLDDRHIQVRLTALAVLTDLKVQAPRATVIVDEGLRASSPQARWLAARICGQMGERGKFAIERLVELMGSRQVPIALAAAGALVSLGHEIEPALARLSAGLWHRDRQVRGMTADALRGLGEAARPVVGKLLTGLESDDPKIRLTALEILLHTGLEPSVAVDALFAALAEEPGEGRTRAESILEERARHFGDGVLVEFGDLVSHEIPSVRHTAIRILGGCRCPEAMVPVLARAGLSDDPVLQAGATDILARMDEATRSAAIRDLGSALATALKGSAMRTRARRLLNRMVPADALPILLDLLRSEEAEVRAHAVYALCLLCPEEPGTMPALLARLEDPSPEVRREAVLAVQVLDPRPDVAMPGLPDLLQDIDAAVRAYAGAALATMATPAAPDCGGKTLAEWVAGLRSGDYKVWSSVGGDLVKHGKSALPVMRALRLQQSVLLRRRAASLISGIEGTGDQVMAELALALRDPDFWVRYDAAVSLWHFQDHPLITPLMLRTLDDPSPLPMGAILESLAKTGAEPDRILAVVSPAVYAERTGIRLEAIEAAGLLGARARSLAPRIVTIFEQSKGYEKTVCALALGRIGAHIDAVLALGVEAISSEEKDRRGTGREFLAALGERGREAATLYVARLVAPDELERLLAAQVLLSVDLESQKAVVALNGLLWSSAAAVRRRAAEVVEDWNFEPPAGYVNGLLALLESEDVDVRLETLERIDEILEVPEFIPALVRALSDANRDVRQAALKCLGSVSLETLQPLMEALARTDNGTGRIEAIRWLRVHGHRVVTTSKKNWLPLLKSDDMLDRMRAIRGIMDAGKSTPEIIEALERCLKDPIVSVQNMAKKALKRLQLR